MTQFTPETLPEFGSDRLSYDSVHHIQDHQNIGLRMLIDGREVISIDAYRQSLNVSDEYPHTETPAEREVYAAYLNLLKSDAVKSTAACGNQ